MPSELDVLSPVREIQLSSGQVIAVRELDWRAALRFMERLAALLNEFAAPDGTIRLTLEKLIQSITRSGDLATDLIAQSAALEPDQVARMRPVDVLSLLEAAVALNLHEDLLGKARCVGKSLARVLGADQTQPAGGGS